VVWNRQAQCAHRRGWLVVLLVLVQLIGSWFAPGRIKGLSFPSPGNRVGANSGPTITTAWPAAVLSSMFTRAPNICGWV
jgi:hypothetical protein